MEFKSQRIAKQHQHTFDCMILLRGKHQGRTEECAHARCPAQGKYHAKEHSGKNPISRLFTVLLPPLNKFHFENTKKIEAKKELQSIRKLNSLRLCILEGYRQWCQPMRPLLQRLQ